MYFNVPMYSIPGWKSMKYETARTGGKKRKKKKKRPDFSHLTHLQGENRAVYIYEYFTHAITKYANNIVKHAYINKLSE